MARTSFVDVALRLRGARRFNAEVAAATKQLEAMGVKGAAAMGAMAQRSDRFREVGRSMTMGLTLPIVAAGAAAMKLSLDFSSTFGRIERLVGVSTDQIDAWKEGVTEISDQTAVSAEELGEALFFVASAGLRGQEAIDALSASARAAAAGLGETKTISQAVTAAVNNYGAEVLSATRATDILIKTVAAGNLEPEELAGTLGQVIPIAQSAGVSFDQVGVGMATMTRLGQPATRAATQLASVLMTFAKPTTQMTDALSQMGLSLDGVRKKIRNDGLIPVLVMLRERAQEAGIDLSQVFGNRRALQGVDVLTKDMRITNDVIAMLGDSAGATNKAFAQLEQREFFKSKQAANQAKNAFRQLGDQLNAYLLPQINKLLGMLVWASKLFGRMPKPVQDAALGLTFFAAMLGPVLWMVGALGRGLGLAMVLIVRLIPLIKALALRFALLRVYLWSVLVTSQAWAVLLAGKFLTAVKVATLALGRMAIAALANPYVLLALAVLLLVGALVYAYIKVEAFRKFVQKNWQLILAIMTGGTSRIVISIIQNFGKIKGAATSVVTWVRTAFTNMVGFLKGLPGRISGAVKGAFDGLKDAFNSAIDSIVQKWNDLKGAIPGLGGVIDGIGGVVEGMADGGTITRPGTVLVGERGPELLSLPRAASVIPLSGPNGINAGPQRIEVPVYLNGRQIALAVAGEVADARARS